LADYLELHPLNPQPRLIRRAAEVVRAGGLIAYPTDSCYALGWHLGDTHALERVRRIRQADRHHHFTLVCASLAQIGARHRAACNTSGGAPSVCAFPIIRCRACCSPSLASRS
jgi:tRNA A37 threonylcarbamoyladenosine synthetase subunit TsaC/SUA5/YrdC